MNRILSTIVGTTAALGVSLTLAGPAAANDTYVVTRTVNCAGSSLSVAVTFGYESATGKRSVVKGLAAADGYYIRKLNTVAWVNTTPYSNGATVYRDPVQIAQDAPGSNPFVTRSALHAELQVTNLSGFVVCRVDVGA